MMEGSSEIGIRIKGLIEIRLKKSEKEFVVPDNIEEFDIPQLCMTTIKEMK